MIDLLLGFKEYKQRLEKMLRDTRSTMQGGARYSTLIYGRQRPISNPFGVEAFLLVIIDALALGMREELRDGQMKRLSNVI